MMVCIWLGVQQSLLHCTLQCYLNCCASAMQHWALLCWKQGMLLPVTQQVRKWVNLSFSCKRRVAVSQLAKLF